MKWRRELLICPQLDVVEPVEEGSTDPYMDEEQDAELREYRSQIEKQRKLREAVLQAKEVRRQQAAKQRMLDQGQQEQVEKEQGDGEWFWTTARFGSCVTFNSHAVLMLIETELRT